MLYYTIISVRGVLARRDAIIDGASANSCLRSSAIDAVVLHSGLSEEVEEEQGADWVGGCSSEKGEVLLKGVGTLRYVLIQ